MGRSGTAPAGDHTAYNTRYIAPVQVNADRLSSGVGSRCRRIRRPAACPSLRPALDVRASNALAAGASAAVRAWWKRERRDSNPRPPA